MDVLIKHFTHMTLGARIWDLFSTLFRPEGSQRDHLKAVVYLAIAASPEGYQKLADKGHLCELRNSAKHVLKHLTPQARADMLATPLQLRDDGKVMAKATINGAHGEVSLDLILTRECFYDYLFQDDSLLTQDEIATSCWMDVNQAGENTFLRQLADRAGFARQPLVDNQDTLGLIMTGIVGPGRVGDEHPAPAAANVDLCAQLKPLGLTPSPFVKNASYFEMLSNLAAANACLPRKAGGPPHCGRDNSMLGHGAVAPRLHEIGEAIKGSTRIQATGAYRRITAFGLWRRSCHDLSPLYSLHSDMPQAREVAATAIERRLRSECVPACCLFPSVARPLRNTDVPDEVAHRHAQLRLRQYCNHRFD